jgi:hypothetical protein
MRIGQLDPIMISRAIPALGGMLLTLFLFTGCQATFSLQPAEFTAPTPTPTEDVRSAPPDTTPYSHTLPITSTPAVVVTETLTVTEALVVTPTINASETFSEITPPEPLSPALTATSIATTPPELSSNAGPEAPVEFETPTSYTNNSFGYTVTYPQHWYPSGITYANAFEIRNYPPGEPDTMPERNRASIIFVDTENGSASATDAYLDTLDAGEAVPITLDGHRAIRIQREESARPLGPGASAAGAATEADGITQRAKIDTYQAISTYVDNGKHLLSIEATTPTTADQSVIDDILAISNQVTFFASK